MSIPEGGGEAADRFEMEMIKVAGKRISCVCRDGESLERELRKPWDIYDMVILFAGSGEELEWFISFRELLEDLPVLLVLPESSRDICKRAHLLRPRFMSFANGDFSDFSAVLRKMIANREETLKRTVEKVAGGNL